MIGAQPEVEESPVDRGEVFLVQDVRQCREAVVYETQAAGRDLRSDPLTARRDALEHLIEDAQGVFAVIAQNQNSTVNMLLVSRDLTRPDEERSGISDGVVAPS